MQKDVISPSIDEFYYLRARRLVKDERIRANETCAFGEYFQGVEAVTGAELDIPLEWLLKKASEPLPRRDRR